jgi:hypothetical protein
MAGARPRASRAKAAQSERDAPASVEVPTVNIEIEDLYEHKEPLNIVIYGPSGAGKTSLASAAPNATFLSTESGVVAAKVAGSQAKLMRARTWSHCIAGINKAEELLGEEDFLIVDSITKMQRLQIRGLLQYQNAMNGARDLDIPGLKDHQKWQNQFVRFIDQIFAAPYNSILIAGSMTREDSNGDDETIPMLIGGERWLDISKYICHEADVVLYYNVSSTASTDEITIRRALAQSYPPYFAKDRYDALGKYWDVEEYDYSQMAAMIDAINEVRNA